jgi:hypothetical protein
VTRETSRAARGIDLVGSTATWGHLAERALRSLLPAASDPEASASRPEARRLSAEEWLRVLGGARIARRPTIGLGDDFELTADGLIGARRVVLTAKRARWEGLARDLTVLDLRTMVCPANRRRTGKTGAHQQERLMRPQRAILAAAQGSWSEVRARAKSVLNVSTVFRLGRHLPRRTASARASGHPIRGLPQGPAPPPAPSTARTAYAPGRAGGPGARPRRDCWPRRRGSRPDPSRGRRPPASP